MNVQRWLKLRRPYWEKLNHLVKLIDKSGGKSLSRQQLQEFGRLYRSASADLSRARAMNITAFEQLYLNNLVVKAHNQVYQNRRGRLSEIVDFLNNGFPILVRRYSLYVLLALIIFGMSVLVSYRFALTDVHFGELEFVSGHPIVPDEMWYFIEHHQLWTDGSEKASPVASSMLATHNIQVAVLCFVFGLSFGLGTAFLLFMNGLNVGTVFGVCQDYGMGSRLLSFVAPHAILEFAAVLISAAAGLLLGKAMLFPGRLTRLDALKSVSEDALGLFLGCIPLLTVAALIEAFISPRTDWEPMVKYAVSIATMLCLVFYLLIPKEQRKRETRL